MDAQLDKKIIVAKLSQYFFNGGPSSCCLDSFVSESNYIMTKYRERSCSRVNRPHRLTAGMSLLRSRSHVRESSPPGRRRALLHRAAPRRHGADRGRSTAPSAVPPCAASPSRRNDFELRAIGPPSISSTTCIPPFRVRSLRKISLHKSDN